MNFLQFIFYLPSSSVDTAGCTKVKISYVYDLFYIKPDKNEIYAECVYESIVQFIFTMFYTCQLSQGILQHQS